MQEVGQVAWDSNVDEQTSPQHTIIGGRYRVLHLLYRRPRISLYLAQRTHLQPAQQHKQHASLVAIRELALADLPSHTRKQIEQAAFEEFVTPIVFTSPRLPGAGDRIHVEGEHLYIVKQLNEAGQEELLTLDELLNRPHWPLWLDTEAAISWGAQLCRMVARLHRLGIIQGALDLNTILLDRQAVATQSLLLLASWPPPPHLWPRIPGSPLPHELCAQIFPIAINTAANVFAAPETLHGVYNELSDVYSLGAVLYLLCTRYAPAAALRRRHAAWVDVCVARQEAGHTLPARRPYSSESIPLIPPRLLNEDLPSSLERIIVQALALDPAERYPSAFALAEALENC